jgi:hypothetical protein
MRERKDNKKSDGPGAVADKFDDVYQRMEALASHAHDLAKDTDAEKSVDDWWSDMEAALQKMQSVSGEIREPSESGMEEPKEEEPTDQAEVQEDDNMNDIDETIARLSKLAGLSEAGKKPDADKDGIPDWADKNPHKKGGDEDRIEESACATCHKDPCECDDVTETVEESVELDECGVDMMMGGMPEYGSMPELTMSDIDGSTPEQKDEYNLSIRTPTKTMTFVTDNPEEIIKVLRASGVDVVETESTPVAGVYAPPAKMPLPTQAQMNRTTDEDALIPPGTGIAGQLVGQAANQMLGNMSDVSKNIGGGLGQAIAGHIANVAQQHFTAPNPAPGSSPAAPSTGSTTPPPAPAAPAASAPPASSAPKPAAAAPAPDVTASSAPKPPEPVDAIVGSMTKLAKAGSGIEDEEVEEDSTKKKPDEDGDGVPDWADKKPGKDDNEEDDEDEDKKVEESIMRLRALSGYKIVDEAKWGNSVAGPSGEPGKAGDTADFAKKGTGKGKSGRGDKGLATVGDNPLGHNDRDLTEAKMMGEFARFLAESNAKK